MEGFQGFIASLVWFLGLVSSGLAYSNYGPGTTRNISDVVTGRCQEYKLCLHGEPCRPTNKDVDCNDVLQEFLAAWTHQDPCRAPVDAFDGLLNMIPPQALRDKTTFWSGVAYANIPQDVAQVTTEYTVLEETFPGYMAGNLSWCGTEDPSVPSGINFTVCPVWTSADCPNNTKAAFWDRASEMLASQAAGNTYVVLNAQRSGGAFNNGSVFARKEAPNLNPSRVTNVAIYLIPDFTLPTPNFRYRETCTNGTIVTLQNMLTRLGLNHTCEEDPTTIMWLQCARFPDSPYCGRYNGAIATTFSYSVFLLQLCFVLLTTAWNS